jgi:hypothetical protein
MARFSRALLKRRGATPEPVCAPGSLPGFVDTVTTVARPRVTRRVGACGLLPRSPASSTHRLLRRALALDPFLVLPLHAQCTEPIIGTQSAEWSLRGLYVP